MIARGLAFILLALATVCAQDRDLSSYALVFSDEFNELSVGSHRGKGDATWGDWPPTGPHGAFSASQWAQVGWIERWTVSAGILSLWMEYNPDNGWVSGFLASMDLNKNGFAQKFGYWSARIKMPQAGQGAWTAFWLGSTNGIRQSSGTKGYEIDILEWYGTNTFDTPPDKYGWSVHPWNVDGSQGAGEGGSFVNIPGGDAVNTWHVYGCEVNPENIIFYLDGQEVGRRPTNLEYLEDPLYVMVNYALRNDHSGQPFASRGDSAMQVDWVRAYSLPSGLPAPTNLRVTGP
jgi:beta-glucanase (GH16 family)